MKLYHALDVVPSDLRGLGLQGTKLEGAAANAQSRVGQDVPNQPKLSDFLKPKDASVPKRAPPSKDARVREVLSSPVREKKPRTAASPGELKMESFYERVDGVQGSPAKAAIKASPRGSPGRGSPRRGAKRGRPRNLNVVVDKHQPDIRAAFGTRRQVSVNGRLA